MGIIISGEEAVINKPTDSEWDNSADLIQSRRDNKSGRIQHHFLGSDKLDQLWNFLMIKATYLMCIESNRRGVSDSEKDNHACLDDHQCHFDIRCAWVMHWVQQGFAE